MALDGARAFVAAGKLNTLYVFSGPEKPRSQTQFRRGDCDGDGQVTPDVTDAVFLLDYNFLGVPKPPCLAACDANGDGKAEGQVTDAGQEAG